MDFSIKELIRQRHSVRTFDGRPLTEEDRRSLGEYVSALDNPFGVPVTFRLLDARKDGLFSPVIVGAEEYLAAKVARTANFEIAFGYSFEKACLFALSRGVGTVMLAASLNRPAFEKAMDVRDGEVMPVASPIGYPAEKRSLRESLMRKGVKADKRKPFEDLFFSRTFGQGLDKADAGVFAQALELTRWAPSAANGQPWRAVADRDRVHFYEARSMKDSPLGDIQKVDVGIALAHFELALRADGVSGSFVFDDPGIPAPEHTHYIVTYKKAE